MMQKAAVDESLATVSMHIKIYWGFRRQRHFQMIILLILTFAPSYPEDVKECLFGSEYLNHCYFVVDLEKRAVPKTFLSDPLWSLP